MNALPFSYTDFHGGLNTKDAPYLLTDDQARDLQNVQGTPAGAIVKRAGLVTFSTPAATLNSLYGYEAALPKLIAAGSTHLYAIDTAGAVTTIASGLTANSPWEWVQSQPVAGQGPLYGMNGVDPPQQWTGTGSTSAWTATSGALPNGKYMLLAGNRIWVSGVPGNPARVYFSDLIPVNNGPLVWPPANVAVFDENDGSPITGLAHVGPYILVCKARKLYIISDLNTGDARRLSDNVGCIAYRTLAAAPEGTYFLAEDRGVYVTNGSKVTPISDQIQPTIDGVVDRPAAVGVYFNAHYYLSVCTGAAFGQNDTTLDYDATLGSWWKQTIPSSDFAIWHPTGTAELFSAKSSAAIVDQCFVPGVTVDNGTPFTWLWRGPWQSPSFYRRRRFPTPYYRKRFRQLRYDGTGSVDLSVGVDFQDGETLLQRNSFAADLAIFGGTGTFGVTGTFGGSASIQRARQFSLGVHQAISVVFSATSTTADRVNSYTMYVTDRKDLQT